MVGPFDQYLNWLVCGVYKVQSWNRMCQGPVNQLIDAKTVLVRMLVIIKRVYAGYIKYSVYYGRTISIILT